MPMERELASSIFRKIQTLKLNGCSSMRVWLKLNACSTRALRACNAAIPLTGTVYLIRRFVV